MISIGGNDVGFSRLVADAVLSDKSLLKWLGGWLGEIEEAAAAKGQLGALYLRYLALDRAIRNILHLSWEENHRGLPTAYSRLPPLEGGNPVCPNGRAGLGDLP